jgi:hypothetical protein
VFTHNGERRHRHDVAAALLREVVKSCRNQAEDRGDNNGFGAFEGGALGGFGLPDLARPSGRSGA